jgi:prefoldin subunit 5
MARARSKVRELESQLRELDRLISALDRRLAALWSIEGHTDLQGLSARAEP